MRILYFADIRFPLERANGIQTMETCHALRQKGHDVALVVRPDTRSLARDPFDFYGLSPVTGAPGSLAIERIAVPASPAVASRAGYLSFAFGRALGKSRADVIMTRDLGVASALLRIPRALRPPLVYESHGFAPDVAQALPALISTATQPSTAKIARLTSREAHVWRNAEGYVTITQGIVNHLEHRFGRRDCVAVIPDGVRVIATPSPVPREPIVAYAGHLYPWKGVDILLSAVALVPDVHAVIVGGHRQEPDLERVERVAAELGIGRRVRFTGFLEPGQVAGYLMRARILALPNPRSAISSHFTSPLKLFEYLAVGRPIVASDLPAIREVVHDGEHALLVESGNAEALAAAMRRLCHDHELAERLARNALRLAPEYTWTRRAERLEALFGQVLTP